MNQKIDVPLRVGSRVTLYEDVDMDDGGMAASVLFEDTVERYVPETGLLEFVDSDIGRSEFIRLSEEADGIQIVKEKP